MINKLKFFIISLTIAISVLLFQSSISNSQTPGYLNHNEVAQYIFTNARRIPDPEYIPYPLISKEFTKQEMGRILISLSTLNGKMIGFPS